MPDLLELLREVCDADGIGVEEFDTKFDLPGESAQFLKYFSISDMRMNLNDFGKKTLRFMEGELYEDLETPKMRVRWDGNLKDVETDSIAWSVQSLIPNGGLIQLAGKRSSYKSFVAQYMATCIASGQKVFGKFDVSQSNVLYIDEENGIGELKSRAGRIKAGLGITSDLPIAYLSYENFKIDNPINRKSLERFIRELGSCVIIVDTLRRITSVEENDATAMNEIFTDYIRPFCKKGVTWIFLHHMRKGMPGKSPTDHLDELRGSSEITNVADSVLVFEKSQAIEGRVAIRHAKSRRTKPEEPMLVSIDWKDDKIVFNHIGTAEDLLTQDYLCSKEILKWVEESSSLEFQTRDVIGAMEPDFHPKTISRALNILVEQCRLRRIRKGTYQLVAELDEETNGQSLPVSSVPVSIGDFTNIDKSDKHIVDVLSVPTEDVILNLYSSEPKGYIELEEAAKRLGIDESVFNEHHEKLRQESRIFEPRNGYWQRL